MNERLNVQSQNNPETTVKTSEYKLTHDPEELLGIWTQAIDEVGTGEKVWLRTMLCKAGHTMDSLKPHLIDAAKRGADVRIIYDPISYYLSDKHIPSYFRHMPVSGLKDVGDDYEKNKKLLEELSTGGVRMEKSRPESLIREAFPYKGADHIKGTRIGDRYWFTTDNLEDGSFMQMKGFAIEIDNTEMVEKLTEIIGSTDSPDKDQVIDVDSDPETKIIWDAGIPGKSTIYEAALGIIARAHATETVGTAVQFFPEGEFLKNLEQAQSSGVNTSIVTSPQDTFHISPYRFINLINLNRMTHGNSAKSAINNMIRMIPGRDEVITPITPLRIIYAKPDGVHAKYVVSYPDKDQLTASSTAGEVEFGTNNHSEWGIKAGTAELAIYSTNPKFVNPIRRYHEALASNQL